MTSINTNATVLPPPQSASELFSASSMGEHKIYWDRSHYGSPEAQQIALEKSATLYIGNLAFDTTTLHLQALFTKIGRVKRIILGLDRMQKTPCGFAFVEYYKRRHAEEAIAYLTGTKLDGRIIRVELDAGFQPGREYGRGAKGGQVRDDRRSAAIDPARSRRSWEPPSSGGRSGPRPYPGQRGGGPRPYPNFQPATSSPAPALGEKRGRDDDDGGEEGDGIYRPSSKNVRLE
uniref:Nuclear cap-binding protein subunit 2 n=1 Tax=Leptocylindrus danicus TaxID=163516 RepID=A0A7S2PF73_9STRA|mmetsp:Transcript_30297/g.44569  ORF Transcript_30297/g.44569 Transcript_30297/m.44569 type:complete len:233 (+) Transcript_30297:76-774(+)|eukprot:CAMPEP_0116013146 /NCGR_PEP_ID=MMETSP0321-20121206/5553_1 /TAXON_ID=163516 /ORGANISM="Leptocylindrus danicus var. danicus, Strain B650" /LENGTH=232 /DNA_ID=CAMNT_0003482641 /DNA_START=989 /DNA_END=1687 /DNA_ORIENTATION=-